MTTATHPVRPTLEGRRALVTGAASGIGAAVAARLAAAGAEVHLLDRDEEGVAKVAAQVHGTPHVVDLTDPAAIARLDLDVDVLVNNAGVQHVAPVEDFDPERFRTIHALMLHAPFLLAQRVLPGMYARGWGRLVHVSSVHGHRASAFKSAYVSAKHGLEGLSKVIALEGADRGVTSNTVCPGYVRTPLVEGQIADQARAHGVPDDEVVDTVLLARTPLKRLVEPEEVADAVAFLCSPAATSMTGTSLLLDGGWTAA
ncbi:3-hydroxybutyrate dehydrogenase [Nocardioides okcheonensis]|uniref:3-hydroxybutyrate dehydrogenase n=1 Tax=Nocardioides okcheonensis TaxID=2894081 RepID=UPI001E51842C|nr:3-hydroxybutyrate dehydrogenase [Nocardioides okcheonensis]UFN43752.1 3-hydroxybutyrate dehydrogenase [Nocardioides okcheonensis]